MRIREWSVKQWCLLAGAVIVLFLVAARLHLKWKVHRAVTELRERGMAVSKTGLYENYVRIPDDENAAILLAQARKLLPSPSGKELDLLPVVGNYMEVATDEGRWPEDVMAAAKRCLEERSDGLELVRLAVQRPGYWVDRSKNLPGETVSALGDVQFIVSLLRLRIRYDLQTGNWNAVPSAIEAQIRIGNLMSDEPSMIGQLVRMAYYTIALFDLERYLNAAGREAGDLSGILTALKIATVNWQLNRTVEWERVEALEPIYWKSDPLFLQFDFDAIYSGYEPDDWEKTFERMKVILYRFFGLGDLDLLYLLDAFDRIEHVSTQSLPAIADMSANAPWLVPSANGHSLYFWSEMVLPIWKSAGGKWVDNQARLRAAMAAVAVTQYRAVHGGELPESLAGLVPEFLGQVPLEPRSDKPFELTETGRGFAIGRGAPVFTVTILNP